MHSTTEAPKKSNNILELLPGSLPKAKIPPNVDLEAAVSQVLELFPRLQKHHFTPDALWRDTYALTGTIRTFYFDSSVASTWASLSDSHGLLDATLVAGSVKVIKPEAGVEWIDCSFTFKTLTPATECSGILSLVPSDDGQWRIWVLRTFLEQLSGHGNVDKLDPANGGAEKNGNSGTMENHHYHFGAVVIGGGQSGLSVGGRLKALGVSYVILEKNVQAGDAWKLRYESARLHTIREYSHLPFERTFGPEYDEYLSKDELAKGHKQWAEKYRINIWLSTTAVSGSWDEATRVYTLDVVKNGQPLQITTRHVVFATGANSQTPAWPNIADKMHSVDYKDAKAWTGKSGIVVGAANTAHDVADDMWQAGMQVTMVQRSRIFVLPVEFIKERYNLMYNSNIPTETSDRGMFSLPISIARILSSKVFHAMARAQPERYEALERAGFKVDPFGDIQDAINVRLGGHYIDVGTSAKIGKNLIKVKSDAHAVRYTESGLIFSDGVEIKADIIVIATGFVGNLRQHAKMIFGPVVARRAGDCFGLNTEGEVLGAFKPTKQPGMWYMGGALGHARYFSHYIALSIKADDMGQPLPVYEDGVFKLDGLNARVFENGDRGNNVTHL
ncbi:hypothetical protein CEK25_003745 [Fusarium fujikuroi]|nr:hypothetical protein CEK25_003745 [Fusarium fujikuroi]